MMGDQGLVRGNDMLAALEGVFDERLGDTVRAADQFNDQIDIIGVGHQGRVVVPVKTGNIDSPVERPGSGRHGNDVDIATGPQRQQFLMSIDDLNRAGADGSQSGYADPECAHDASLLR